jgi:hypothetical protein
MPDEDLDKACLLIGEELVKLYINMNKKYPKQIVITAMTGTLATCATIAGYKREGILAALNSAFDDIEGEE